jgi:DNA-binding SARP family transcriptional activator
MRAMPGTPPRVPPLVPGGLAVLGAAGGVVLLARRRYRTSLSEPPVPPDHEVGIPIRAGWADPAHARTFANRLDGGTEPALLVAEQVLHYLQQAGMDDVTIVTVREGRHSMALTLRGGLEIQERLLQIGPELAEQVGATGIASRTPDHDILLQLTRLALLRVAVRPSGSPLSPIPLLALGVLPLGEALHANWRALGHVLIVGTAGSGANIVLTNVLTTLAARCHPDQLRLYTIAAREALAPPLLDLPHQWSGVVAPTDSPRVQTLLDELRSELERRMQLGKDTSASGSKRTSDIVLVLPELANLANNNRSLELLEAQGPAFGMHIIAATTRHEDLDDVTLETFGTRLVMRTLEETASVRLLGRPDAADLGGGGDLFMRIDGREPIRLQSFRVEPEHLDRLVDLMHAAFRDSAQSEEPVPTAGTDGATGAEQSTEVPLGNAWMAPAPDAVVPLLAPPANATAPIGVTASTAPSAGITISVNGHVVAASAAGPPSPDGPACGKLQPEATQARIQIRCFGELEVLGDGRPLSARGQYLPWELLILLALQPSAGVAKQDLLRLLWPNIDHELGDRRLRAAMVRLRVVLSEQLPDLPADVVRGQRNGTCHLASELVWSDAQHFLSLCRQAARVSSEQTIGVLEQVRAAYGGELFTQPSFDWMDRRVRGITLRERYREDHAAVTLQLAERYEAEGRPALAVPLYTELLHAQPTLQEVARRLYRCCAKLGDHSTLKREHARLLDALDQIRRTVHLGQAHAYTLEQDTLAAHKEALAALAGASPSQSAP